MYESIRIACMGDTMPAGILHYEKDVRFCNEELMRVLRDADIRVATLETAIGDYPNFDREKMKRNKDVIYCPTKDVFRLKRLGIDVVSLANNHAWDLGIEGIERTFQELDKLGIKYCGAGHNLREAAEPVVITVKGKTVAFIAYCDYNPGTCGYIPIASDSQPGINAMIEGNIYSDINKLKCKYDYLFVMMHWGKEYYYYPLPRINRLARKIIDWGADGIIGSHSHQIQPTISYKGKPIIFSLGNFFFPDRIITVPRSTYYPQEAPVLQDLPKTLGYPFVEKETLKIWKPNARKGQVLSLVTNKDCIIAERTFTVLDKDSHLDIYKGSNPTLFKLSHLLVKMPLYNVLFFFMRGCRFIRKKITREL